MSRRAASSDRTAMRVMLPSRFNTATEAAMSRFRLLIAASLLSLGVLAGGARATQVQIDPSHGDPGFQGEVAMTVGQSYAPQRSIKVVCTVAGNVSVTYVD